MGEPQESKHVWVIQESTLLLVGLKIDVLAGQGQMILKRREELNSITSSYSTTTRIA